MVIDTIPFCDNIHYIPCITGSSACQYFGFFRGQFHFTVLCNSLVCGSTYRATKRGLTQNGFVSIPFCVNSRFVACIQATKWLLTQYRFVSITVLWLHRRALFSQAELFVHMR